MSPVHLRRIDAKLERRRIIDRTTRGRADAKATGVKFGRKPKLTPHQKAHARRRREKAREPICMSGGNVSVTQIDLIQIYYDLRPIPIIF